ncbi:MAG: HAD family hydrolase [Candidatus Binataceae bacterium]
MAKYDFKAVVLDLFDTIVTWDQSRLELMTYRGRELRTTTPLLFPVLSEALGDRFDQAAFMDAHYDVYQEIFAERLRDEVEITCHERFERTLKRLGLEEGLKDGELTQLAERLRQTHMARVRAVTQAPAARIEAVKRLKTRFRLGLLSNFDDSATGYEIVADTGVGDLFDIIVISAEFRVRKPHTALFRRVLEALKLDPKEVLFVGDTAHEDVVGAKRAGMPVAWINKHNKPFPEGIAPPEITIDDLSQLPNILGC